MISDLGNFYCLSIRQPWAWLIVNGWKNVENRTWPTRLRGRICVHAAVGMTRGDYDACEIFIRGFSDLSLPAMNDLSRGGIVGAVTVLDCVTSHPSEWFVGPYGFVLADAEPLREIIPCRGALGFFRCPVQP
jgi:hypothetical protein